MAGESDEKLDQLRQALNLFHEQCEKANQPLLKRLMDRFQPPSKKQRTEIRKPKDAA